MSSAHVERPSGSPSAFGRRVPGGLFAIVAVVVTAVLLISVGLLVTAGTASRTTGAVSFYAARSMARSELGPGNWSLFYVVGSDLWNGTSLPTSMSTAPAGCTVSTYPKVLPSTLEIPAYRGDLSDGGAVVWIFEYGDAARVSEAGVVVVNGAVAEAITMSGTTCGVVFTGVSPIPSGAVDSFTAAQAIDAAGANYFLATNRTGVSLIMTLFGGFTSVAPPLSSGWTFSYSPCSGLLTGNQSGPTNGVGFLGSVNATTGAVLTASEQSVDCMPFNTTVPPGIYDAVSFGSPMVVVGSGTGGSLASQGCASGDYCYALRLTSTQMNVTPNDMSLWIQDSTGVPSLVPHGYAFLDPQGNVLVYSTSPIESAWTSGIGTGTALLVAGDTLEIDMGSSNPAGMGYMLNIEGEGPFAGSGEGFGLP